MRAAGLLAFIVSTAALAAPGSTVVVTFDAESMQIGLAGASAPSATLPTAVVRSKPAAGVPLRYAFGAEALAKAGREDVVHTVAHGQIADWPGFQALLEHALTGVLKVDPASTALLISAPPLNPKADREQLTRLLFDGLHVAALFVAIDAVLSLYASGRTTGLVLQSGADVSHAVAIYEGYALPHAVLRLDLAQADVRRSLAAMLRERGETVSDAEAAAIDRALDYVALDFDAELAKGAAAARKTFTAGGRTIALDTERFRAPEALLRPSLIKLEQEGVARAAFDSIMKCDVDIRKDLFGNLVLAGGGTDYPGLAERMTREMKALAPDSMVIKVIAPPERARSAWIGGSILGALSTFQEMWTTRAQYQASGAAAVHVKATAALPKALLK